MANDNSKRKSNKTNGELATIAGLLLLGLAVCAFLALNPKSLMRSLDASWFVGLILTESIGTTWLVSLILFLCGISKLGQSRSVIAGIGGMIVVASIGLFIWR